MSVIEVKCEVHGQFSGVRRLLLLCLLGFICPELGCGGQGAHRGCALALLLLVVPRDKQCLCAAPLQKTWLN